jgi:hypothetical protein
MLWCMTKAGLIAGATPQGLGSLCFADGSQCQNEEIDE